MLWPFANVAGYCAKLLQIERQMYGFVPWVESMCPPVVTPFSKQEYTCKMVPLLRQPDRMYQPNLQWTSNPSSGEKLPPFSLIRDFGKQNTCGNVSKISVSRACY